MMVLFLRWGIQVPVRKYLAGGTSPRAVVASFGVVVAFVKKWVANYELIKQTLSIRLGTNATFGTQGTGCLGFSGKGSL